MNRKNSYTMFFFIVGLIIIAVMLYNLGWNALVLNLKRIGPAIIVIILTRLLVYPLNACAWRTLSYLTPQEKKKLSWLRMFRLTISGYAINYITPVMALGGEPYRIMAIKQELGTKKATSSVLTYAMMHILSHFCFWIIGFLLLIFFLYDTCARFIFISSIIFIAISVVAIIYIIKGYKKGVIVGFFNFLLKIPFLKKWVRKKMTPEFVNSIHEIDKQFTDLYNYHKGAFYKSLVLETSSRIFSCAEILVTLWAVGYSISMIDAIIVSTQSALISNIAFFFPMQVGVREGALTVALGSIGLPKNLGVFVGIITRITELFWIIIGIVLIKMKRFKSKQNDE